MICRTLPVSIVTVVSDVHDEKAEPPIDDTLAGTMHELEEGESREGLDG